MWGLGCAFGVVTEAWDLGTGLSKTSEGPKQGRMPGRPYPAGRLQNFTLSPAQSDQNLAKPPDLRTNAAWTGLGFGTRWQNWDGQSGCNRTGRAMF